MQSRQQPVESDKAVCGGRISVEAGSQDNPAFLVVGIPAINALRGVRSSGQISLRCLLLGEAGACA